MAMVAASYASMSMSAEQPFAMTQCEKVVSQLTKQLPLKVDQITTRTGVKCAEGKTKPAMLVMIDSVESKSSASVWKEALRTQEGKSLVLQMMCFEESSKKILQHLDLEKKLILNGHEFAKFWVTEKSCQNKRVYIKIK